MEGVSNFVAYKFDKYTGQAYMKIEQVIEEQFSNSALPRTMSLARWYRKRIFAQLGDVGEGFPFEDRVLIWLAPHWKEDVQKYHQLSGKGMIEWFDDYQLMRMDEHYHGVLRRRLGT